MRKVVPDLEVPPGQPTVIAVKQQDAFVGGVHEVEASE
jgi:hypothetical protein